MPDLAYQYVATFTVIIEGDGQHADGNGAAATCRRLRDQIQADSRVIAVTQAGPQYTAPRERDR